MGPLKLLLILLGVTLAKCGETANNRTARDSYLDAYKDSHREMAQPEISKVKSDREYVTDAHKYYYPSSQQSLQFGASAGPQSQYGAPIDEYGPPSGPYPGPKPIYGPPAYTQSYGPPNPVYGPPPPQPFYGIPYAMLGFLDKLKHKIDLFLIGKILLKLVIFKKFISFIAILCLLLFIPTLKNKINPMSSNDENDEKMRLLKNGVLETSTISNLTSLVTGGIEKFSRKYKPTNSDSVL